MAYLFIDESGDLGFNKKSSKWFLFTIALTSNKRLLERVIKKARKSLKKEHKNVNELHSYHADKITRKRILRALSIIKDLKILCVILNKDKVHIDLQNQKNYLYNYVANILLDSLNSRRIMPDSEHFDIYIDRKDTNKNLRNNFEKYLKTSLGNKRTSRVNITLRASHEEKALQAVDFISWAIFRKYEKGDFEYYEIVKDKIVEENLLFP